MNIKNIENEDEANEKLSFLPEVEKYGNNFSIDLKKALSKILINKNENWTIYSTPDWTK